MSQNPFPIPSHHPSDDCEAGDYAANAGEQLCKNCQSIYGERYTSKHGGYACDVCTVDFVMDTNADADACGGIEGVGCCISDPCKETNDDGSVTYKADCREEGTLLHQLKVKKGYYRFNIDSTQVFACSTINCIGGKINSTAEGAADVLCDTGATGPLCSVCQDQFFVGWGGKCWAGSIGNAWAGPLAAIAVLFVGSIVGLCCRKRIVRCKWPRSVVGIEEGARTCALSDSPPPTSSLQSTCATSS